MIVSHGYGGSAKDLSNTFCPYAATYDLIIIFPQVMGGWDSDGNGPTGKLSNTKNGIYGIFFRHLIEQVAKPIDRSTFDYKRPE